MAPLIPIRARASLFTLIVHVGRRGILLGFARGRRRYVIAIGRIS
jgi:hypothetical protein